MSVPSLIGQAVALVGVALAAVAFFILLLTRQWRRAAAAAVLGAAYAAVWLVVGDLSP